MSGASTVNLYGIVENAGNTLAIDASASTWNLYGEIQGGTVTTTAGSLLLAPQGGALDDVDLIGNLDLTGGSLAITDGLTVNGTLSIDGPYYATTSLSLSGTQTVGGSGQIVFGAAGDQRHAPEQSNQHFHARHDGDLRSEPYDRWPVRHDRGHGFRFHLCQSRLDYRECWRDFNRGVAMDQQWYVRGAERRRA